MSLFIYCYNVFFVLLFTFTLSTCFLTYGATNRKIFQYFGVLMFAYIVESICMVIFDFFSMDSSGYFYLGCLILFCTVELYIIGKTIYAMFGKEGRKSSLFALCLASAAVSTCSLTLSKAVGQLLVLNMFSIMLMIFYGLYRYLLRREPDGRKREEAAKYQTLMGIMFAFSALSFLENIIYTFWAWTFVDQVFPFYGGFINFFSDAFCVVLSIWLILFTQREREKYMSQKIEGILQQRMNEFQVYEQEKSKAVKSEQLVEFCEYYELTDRETEILRLILEGKTNQELSKELYITVGTVKAHVHSIFGKLEVTRRSQLMTMFMNYGKKK